MLKCVHVHNVVTKVKAGPHDVKRLFLSLQTVLRLELGYS